MSKKNGAKKRPSQDKGVRASAQVQNKEFEKALRRDAMKQHGKTIVVIALAVLLAVGMMLPSLAAIVSGMNSSSTTQADASGSTTATSSETTEVTMETIDESYGTTVSTLEAKLADNQDDLATLLNLGDSYMSWAYAASTYATTDNDTLHVNELWAKAIDYFDRYLALNESDAVKVNRALCQFYSGETAAATSALEELTQTSPSYGPGWANLGLTYEATGETEKAKAAYQQAIETDQDDEYGAKSFAESRLSSMEAASSSSNVTVGTSGQGLSDVLADATGTGL